MADTNFSRRNHRFIDLAGQRFGKWTVIDEAIGYKPPVIYWNVLCDCGHSSVVPGPAMRRGRSSCCTNCRVTTHGKSRSPEYQTWMAMRSRCRNPSNQQYSDYGSRGIDICPAWDSFETFYADMGPRTSRKHTIERLDNDKGYSVDNCKWATRPEQLRNTRRTRRITFNGRTLCIADWATELGISYKTLQNRINRGWSIEDALGRCVSNQSRKLTLNGKSLNMSQWSKETGIPKSTIRRRLLSGWSVERALTTLPKQRTQQA